MADPLSEMIKVAVREALAECVKTTDLRPQRLLDPEQAAEYLHVSRSKIYEMLRDGDIPVVRCGRSTLVDKDDLEAWIKTHKRVGVEAA